VGELVRRISGKPFGEFIQTEIAKPLDLDGLFVGLTEDAMHRRAQLIGSGLSDPDELLQRMRRTARAANRALKAVRIPIDLSRAADAMMPAGMQDLDFNSEALVSACIPAANGMFTARSLARMYAALANGGELDGVRLMGPETLGRATRIQNRGLDRVVPIPMQWRLGYHRAFAPFQRVPRAFGHFGFGGSGAWACPERNLSVAFTVNSGVGTPFGDSRVARLGVAAVKAADRRAPR
jgi:CubicO group peptidase (beta-lactamase class C family)